MNAVAGEMKQGGVGVMALNDIAETVWKLCKWKRLHCYEGRSEKWNTQITF